MTFPSYRWMALSLNGAQPKIGTIPNKAAVFSWGIHPGQLIAEAITSLRKLNNHTLEMAVNLGPREEYAANTTLPKSFPLPWFPPDKWNPQLHNSDVIFSEPKKGGQTILNTHILHNLDPQKVVNQLLQRRQKIKRETWKYPSPSLSLYSSISGTVGLYLWFLLSWP